MVIDFIVLICIALVAIAFIEWLKQPLPKVSKWVWWALAPVLCVAGSLLWYGLSATAVFLGLVAFALATLFYDLILKWAKAKIESLQ